MGAMFTLACLMHWYVSALYVAPVVAVGGWGWWSTRTTVSGGWGASRCTTPTERFEISSRTLMFS